MTKHLYSGKVREIWDLGDDRLAMISTDRLSAYDVILPDPIPDRGRVLTQMSSFWFDHFADLVPGHLDSIADEDVDALPDEIGESKDLRGRTMICRRAEMLPVECIVRGYLYGSAWREYDRTGAATGMDLPSGMKIAQQLPEPVFTPSTKAEQGDHDENITMERAREIIGDLADKVAELSLEIYNKGAAYARERGVLIADTKFEFGLIDGELVLCDEVLTPDSSRFWYESEWEAGQDPPALDKQFVRKYLDTLDWDKTAPGPQLDPEIVATTRSRYIEVFERLTDRQLQT